MKLLLLIVALVCCSFSESQEVESNDIECTLCTTIVQFVENYLSKNETEEEIIEKLDGYCSKLPFGSKICKELVDDYLSVIIKYLEEMYSPKDICKMIGFCPEANDVECDLCETLVGFVEDYLKDNQTEEEIKELLTKYCKKVPLFGDKCEEIVDDYLDVIIQYIEQSYSPEKICQLIGLCPTDEVDEDIACTLCLYVSGYVEKFIAENKTVEEIEKLFEELCAIIPYHDECKAMVEEYLPAIIDFIEEELPPKKICEMIGLCQEEKEEEEIVEDNDMDCSLCKYVVGYVEDFLADNKTEAEIVKELERICALIPFTEECKQLVDEYLPEIIEWLESSFGPEDVCKLLGLCPKQEEEPNEVECQLCQFVVGYVEKFIAENKTEEEMIELLESACHIIPYYQECKALVDEYLPVIIDYIEQSLPPKTVCELIGLCQKETYVFKKMDVKITKIRIN